MPLPPMPIVFANLPTGKNPASLLDTDFNFLLALMGSFQGEIALTTVGNSGPATFNPLTGVLNIPNYSGIGGNVVIETTAGPFAVGNADATIVLNKGAPSSTVINLPAVALRGGLPLLVVDWAGNAGDVTINAAAGETIMGLPSAILGSAGPGVGSAALIQLQPSVNLSGWWQI